jgi:hypothetical protein
MTTNTATAPLATAPQVNLLVKLGNEYADLAIAAATAKGEDAQALIDARPALVERTQFEKLAKREASRVIDQMIALVAQARRNAPRPAPKATPAAEIEDGVYIFNGEIIKVVHAVHGSGKQYARALDLDDRTPGGKARFSGYRPGLIKKLRPEHKMTREQAAHYGALYGVCCNCGATLTADESIERAMGPICAGKFA